MAEPVVLTEGLTKYYGRSRGIMDLSFGVNRGETFGLLGPNGAGKTTTIRILLGLLSPTRGRARVLGLDAVSDSLKVRRRVGYLPGEAGFWGHLTGEQFLDFCCGLRRTRPPRVRRAELARALDADLARPLRQLSRGMKQKVALIQALEHDPELVFLDEPTAGLDPLVQHSVLELLAAERSRGRTVFLSSHNLAEVERVCDRVGIVREGRLVAVEGVAELKRRHMRRLEVTFAQDVPAAALRPEGVRSLSGSGRQYTLMVAGNISGVLRCLSQFPIEAMTFQEATLEEIFLEFYAGEAAGAGRPGAPAGGAALSGGGPR
ncbi:MAG: ABC transporter ATP-binding protein [Acetobacteraceae bacterium]|nr:ABC transporter ATP-binding protein [Acetobacteraceae bacterium]